MNKKIRRTLNRYLGSKLGLPLTFLGIFFGVSSLLILFFEVSVNGQQFSSILDAIYWAFVTLSTTGYGDKVPMSAAGKIVAISLISVGIVAVSSLSGTLASIFIDQNTKARRGMMDCKSMKDHYVICGWKDNMKDILSEILKLSPRMTAEDLVVVSNVDGEKIEELKKEKLLAGLHYVKGDYFSETALDRANICGAKKVVVLADRFESNTPAEVDSKTVMCVLAIRSLSKDIYICAEILDTKFEQYLKKAFCDEIIRARDYSRMIVANSSATNGISQILYDLISPTSGRAKIAVYPVPEELVGRTYADLVERTGQGSGRSIIGVLENTGSTNTLKMEALREAQKTSDVSTLVLNLQEVKGLEANKPVLLPDDGYILRKHSMSIMVERIVER